MAMAQVPKPSVHQRPKPKPQTLNHSRDAMVSAAQAASGASPAASSKGNRRGKVLIFEHVRFERVRCRITYRGFPMNITDFKASRGATVTRGLDGKMHGLHLRTDGQNDAWTALVDGRIDG
jgi:hypothetical protein